MLVHWIWLATRPCMQDRIKVELLRQFQDPEAVFFADGDSYAQIEGLTPEGKAALEDKDLRPAEKILEDCRQANISLLTYADATYPRRLQNIADPPLVFYYKGRLPDFDGNPLIGVVGTRSATPYGLTTAKRLGYQIAKCGGIVVSGMASGIDGVAMKGALTGGGQVVGVLGCGADVVYPLSNRSLFEDVEQYGCLLSEFPPGTPPVGFHFPKRIRIISGLSCGVLIVEAPEKSGALITAHQAADQGRDVFVVPGNIDMPSCVGSNRLLRDGAIAISSGWDVLSEYEALFPDKIHREDTPAKQSAYPDEVTGQTERPAAKVAQKPRIFGKKMAPAQKDDKIGIDNEENSPYSGFNTILTSLSPDEKAVVAAIGEGERLVDDVIAQSGIPAGKVLATLTLLEVKGVVRRLPGRRIAVKT